jgi:hypothetical protein
MKLTFNKSLIISLLILFITNIIYTIMSTGPCSIPSGEPVCRQHLSLIITSLFIGLYAIFFTLISRKYLLNSKYNYFLIIFNTIVSTIFFLFANTLNYYFQKNEFVFWFLHIGYVPLAPYLFLILFGIILFVPLAIVLKNKKN